MGLLPIAGLIAACGGGQESSSPDGDTTTGEPDAGTPGASATPSAESSAPPSGGEASAEPSRPPGGGEATAGATKLVTDIPAIEASVTALQYTHESPKPDQRCANCRFYTAKKDDRGSCQLFPQGLVKAGGWCNGWAAIEAG